MAVKEKTDIRGEIADYLKSKGTTLTWLSTQSDIKYNRLYAILIRKIMDLTDGNLKSINQALGTKFKK